MNNNKAFHGTVLEKPLIPSEEYFEDNILFNNISSSMNDLNAFFVSGNEAISEFFSERKIFDEENQIQALLKTNTSFNKVLETSFIPGSPFNYKGKDYNYLDNDDRKKLYKELVKDGYQAFIMKNDYEFGNGDSGDDIAVFDSTCINILEAKFKINNEWTEYMSIEKAKDYFKKWALSENIDMNISSDHSYEERFDTGFSY